MATNIVGRKTRVCICETRRAFLCSEDNRELKQPRRRRRKQERHKFTYLTVKNNSFCTLCTCIFHYWTFRWRSRSLREMSCFAVVWTRWAYDSCSLLSSYLWSAGSNIIPGSWVRPHFASVMTLNNWEMFAETRGYIFRRRSRCRPGVTSV